MYDERQKRDHVFYDVPGAPDDVPKASPFDHISRVPDGEWGMSSPFDHISGVPDGWKRLFEHRLVVPVEIATRQRAPVVTHDDAIRVQHRYDFEHKRVA